MSDETEENSDGWTLATLLVHLTRLIDGCATVQEVAVLRVMVEAMNELAEAKFITHRVLVESQAEKVALALTAAKEAIDKAEVANDKRFAAVNEFRAVLTNQQSTYITRVEVAAAIERNTERIAEVARRLDRAERGQ